MAISNLVAGEISEEIHIAACPLCKSKDVATEPVGIEFTKMTCNACGNMEVADVWARAEWYCAARKACSICRAIPRNGQWPIEATLAKFGIVRETFGSDSAYVNCPECGTPYWYFFYETMVDWQRETTFVFTRLDIAQTLACLPAADQAAYSERIPAIVEALELDLFDPDAFSKTEAAWKLARYYNCEKLWNKLSRLLNHSDVPVFEEAFWQSFHQKEENDDPEPAPVFEPRAVPATTAAKAFSRGLGSKNPKIKQLATTATCEAAIISRNADAIADTLQANDAEVARTAMWYLTYKARGLNVKPLRTLLIEFVRSGNEFQARCSLKLLLGGRKDGKDPVPPFKFIIGCLRHEKAEVRNEAASQLMDWALSPDEKRQALEILLELLEDKDCGYLAVEQLRKQTEFGETEVPAIIPQIMAMVAKKAPHWEAGMQILCGALKKHIDVSAIYPFIGKGIASGDRRVIETSYFIVDYILAYGIDWSAMQRDLEEGLTHMKADYYGEQLLKLLVGIYTRRQDSAALETLLTHANADIARFAAAAYKEVKNEIQ